MSSFSNSLTGWMNFKGGKKMAAASERAITSQENMFQHSMQVDQERYNNAMEAMKPFLEAAQAALPYQAKGYERYDDAMGQQGSAIQSQERFAGDISKQIGGYSDEMDAQYERQRALQDGTDYNAFLQPYEQAMAERPVLGEMGEYEGSAYEDYLINKSTQAIENSALSDRLAEGSVPAAIAQEVVPLVAGQRQNWLNEQVTRRNQTLGEWMETKMAPAQQLSSMQAGAADSNWNLGQGGLNNSLSWAQGKTGNLMDQYNLGQQNIANWGTALGSAQGQATLGTGMMAPIASQAGMAQPSGVNFASFAQGISSAMQNGGQATAAGYAGIGNAIQNNSADAMNILMAMRGGGGAGMMGGGG